MPDKLKLYAVVAAFAGFLIGFDIAGLFVSKPFLFEYFQTEGLLNWLVLLAGVPGFLTGIFTIGKLADKFGRRSVLKFTALIFMVSALGSGLSNHIFLFILFQILKGFAIGSLSVIPPLYISEISPAKDKFKMISLFPFFAVTGLLTGFALSFFVNHFESNIWRWIFISEMIPALLYAIGLYLVPQSPRWLVSIGLHGEAYLILSRLNPKLSGQQIDKLVDEIDKSLQ
jgi:MFS family permease